jgi:hypothetical protein
VGFAFSVAVPGSPETTTTRRMIRAVTTSLQLPWMTIASHVSEVRPAHPVLPLPT